MCSCQSIPECCVMFSGVKLSMRSFVLLSRLKSDKQIQNFKAKNKLDCDEKALTFALSGAPGDCID